MRSNAGAARALRNCPPSGHFQSGMGVRWNLKFRSYPDLNAQLFTVPNLHSTRPAFYRGLGDSDSISRQSPEPTGRLCSTPGSSQHLIS